MTMTLLSRTLADTPIAIVDLETTGLAPNGDRIVEVAVVRIDPGAAPRLVLDTIVNPQRRVSASEIHGIYEEDVKGAPTFRDLVAPLAEAMDGAIVASFNVYFDIKFLHSELMQAEQAIELPHLCLMWLRPALGLGQRASLERTCADLGVPFTPTHQAASDAAAGAALWPVYVQAASSRGVRTFGELAALKEYKFTKSWVHEPLDRRRITATASRAALKPRHVRSSHERSEVRRREWGAQEALAAYWNALTSALVDQVISPAEIAELRRLQASPLLTRESVRYAHAKIFAGVLDEVTRDLAVDAAETEWLAAVASLLRELGWVPGDSVLAGAGQVSAALPVSRGVDSVPQSVGWWRRLFGS
jgi:DNA polymerase III epsilon subunit-like protein